MGEYLHTFKPFKFIHIPKTAGTAINQSALIERKNTDRRSYGHIGAREIKDIKNFYTFALIRNPYDKVYSSWNFYNSGKGKMDSKLAMQQSYPIFNGEYIHLPIKNRTNPEDYQSTSNGEFKGTWMRKYTEEMANIIYNHWKVDFDFFNFNKNSYK